MATHFQDWGGAFDHLAAQMRAMLKQVHGQTTFRTQTPQAWKPRINLYETPSCFFVCVELAGAAREEIGIEAVPGVLIIRGLREKPNLPECPVGRSEGCEVSVHLMEIDSGVFERQLSLPADVDVEHISALQRDGYLWVVLPRMGSASHE